MGKLEWIIGISIVAVIVIVIVYAMVIYHPCVQTDTFTQKAGEKNQTVNIESFFNLQGNYVKKLGITTKGIDTNFYSTKNNVLKKPLTIGPKNGWTGSVYIVECPGYGPNDSLLINTHFLPKKWKQRNVYIFDLLRKEWLLIPNINENHPNFPSMNNQSTTVMFMPNGNGKPNATLSNFRRNDMVYVVVFTK